MKGISLDMETMTEEYFRAMGYDESTGTPTAMLLESLGLPDVAEDLKGVGG